MTVLSFTVHGMPAPQGSKRVVSAGGKAGGRAVLVESSARVRPWREAVKEAAVKAIDERRADGDWVLSNAPVGLEVHFRFPRPKGHYGTGRNAGKLRASAPLRPAIAPDLSKLIRSTEDALTEAGVWRDDALVVSVVAGKFYSEDGPGATITITEYRRGLTLWSTAACTGARTDASLSAGMKARICAARRAARTGMAGVGSRHTTGRTPTSTARTRRRRASASGERC